MSFYRPIDCRVWGDRKFRALSDMKPSGKALWFYILTGPHTTPVPGLWPFTEGAACGGLNWGQKGYRVSYRELYTAGMCEHDSDAGVIWVPKSIKHNKPNSPKFVKSWFRYIDMLPECDLKTVGILKIGEALAERAESFLESYKIPFGISYPISYPIGYPIQGLGLGLDIGNGIGNPPIVPQGTGTPSDASQIQKPDPRSNTYTPDFQIMFDYFPSGKERREAFNEWKKIKSRKGAHAGLPVPRIATVLQAIHWKCHGKKWTDEDGQFIESFRKFLRRRYWEDTPDDGQMNPIKEFEDYAREAYGELEEKDAQVQPK